MVERYEFAEFVCEICSKRGLAVTVKDGRVDDKIAHVLAIECVNCHAHGTIEVKVDAWNAPGFEGKTNEQKVAEIVGAFFAPKGGAVEPESKCCLKCYGSVAASGDNTGATFKGSSGIKARLYGANGALVLLVNGKLYQVEGNETTEPVEVGPGRFVAERLPVTFTFESAFAFFKACNVASEPNAVISIAGHAVDSGKAPLDLAEWEF